MLDVSSFLHIYLASFPSTVIGLIQHEFLMLIRPFHQVFSFLLLLFCHVKKYFSIQFSSVAQSCPTLCNTMNLSMPGLPVHHRLLESTQTHVHQVDVCDVQFSSVTQLCSTLCDPMDCSMPGLPVHHQLLEFTQTHVHRVGDSIQPSHPLSYPSPPALNLSQHQGLFK